ncbi:hypothetical protein LSUB1_G004232 [Lachnellula subtilissima]|uniref:SH3 domain-containing protein n=1 Tax=Lachnellula subtilissima TaxID=602034 RepID=A0A8H8RPR1_9HELO|nr:hypothetical protein LSUB1_G004232 [Lachnellula subtilissima]
MAFHDHFHRRHGARAAMPEMVANEPRAPVADSAQTLVSVVYVTAAQTFDGPVGGYTTVGQSADPTTAVAVAAATNTQQANTQATTAQPEATSAVVAAQSSVASVDDNSSIATATSDSNTSIAAASSNALLSSIPTEISTPASSLASLASSIPILAASTTLASSHKVAAVSSVSGTAAAASASSSSTSASTSGGMSTGGKAGLAIGLLLLFAAVLSIVLFCFKKRKDQQKQKLADNEKNDPFADGIGRQASVQTTRTNPNAPRLSLRPVTQFLPNLTPQRRQSRGNVLQTVEQVAPVSEKAYNERTMTPQADNVANPFGTHAETIDTTNPFGNHAETIDAANASGPADVRVMSPTGEIVAATTGAPSTPPSSTAIPVGIALARGASKRENGRKEMDFTKSGPFRGPPSPAGTEFSINSDTTSTPAQTETGAAIAAAGGPPNSAVHRVQLDFKPSMEDELELRAGQLIRLLHEYDDGWALCIRLDRAQQGVVPRTCLSTRPVKPRPQQKGPPTARGPPPPPGMRLPQQGRPMSPAMNNGPPRSQSPSGRPMSPAMNNGPPRSQSPSGRPMTPNGSHPRGPPNNQQGRQRSGSASQVQARRNSPPGPSRMNPNAPPSDGSQSSEPRSPPARKPVPGQAL